ncbi:hypothetical protein AKO1_001804 [Acrasis kona]|uniref:Uncharacterized protein n=1 Tax=Acrasis kona TaxID=1008807 RepID=A0AAW2Z9R8_9EUKA
MLGFRIGMCAGIKIDRDVDVSTESNEQPPEYPHTMDYMNSYPTSQVIHPQQQFYANVPTNYGYTQRWKS